MMKENKYSYFSKFFQIPYVNNGKIFVKEIEIII